MNPDELNETERIINTVNFMKKYGLKSSYYVTEFLIYNEWDIDIATKLYEEELGRYMDKRFASPKDFSLDEHLVTVVLELQKKKSINKLKSKELSEAKKQKPNDRCACGSKKKYKKCCGSK